MKGRQEEEYSDVDADSLQCNLSLHFVQALHGIAMRLV
jgi:hypothetical protein